MSQAAEKNRYKSTLNLPRTSFPMKANLLQNESQSLKRWGKLGLYQKLRERGDEKPKGKFVFHDGPPYANGSIHLGHLMNKCLKDFVVRSKTVMGYDVPFVPGWDCHGLPIEHKVMTGLVESGKIKKLMDLDEDVRRVAIRKECEKNAHKFQKLQAEQMQRLLTLADYEDPYLTMQPRYEREVLEVLGDLCAQGLVYRALKPVHWSVDNETALAEAELEYFDREDLSVFVDFECADAADVYERFGLGEDERPSAKPSLMIWTTTPWTLPANMAVAVNERFTYALVRIDGNVTVLAEDLVEAVTKQAGSESVEVLARTTGDKLLGVRYKHPFVNEDAMRRVVDWNETDDLAARSRRAKLYSVVSADYVTLEDGTGLVHTAPGHGTEDYQTGLKENLLVYCPVLPDGTYDEYDQRVPKWLRGAHVFEANARIAQELEASGHLFHSNRFMHSYPHDWRSKGPVIFRATEQWFVGVDRKFHHASDPFNMPLSIRKRATLAVSSNLYSNRGLSSSEAKEFVAKQEQHYTQMIEEFKSSTPDEFTPLSDDETKDVLKTYLNERTIEFHPEWGRNRMRGMLESRPDWCISRQRAWGLPIPSFTLPSGESFMTEAVVRAVAQVVGEKGSDAWFMMDAGELLAQYDASNDSEAPEELRNGQVTVADLRKGRDILDVWFESGSSWNAVMRERSGGADFPVDLYLEGSDQHRGWFQSSLIAGLGSMGVPPYKALLTHGFMVNKDGKKLSKSSGDTIEELFKEFGADVLRWWVSSLAYENDVKVDHEFFKGAGESYRKVRNTLRFMLSNLNDFDVSNDAAELGSIDPACVDAWALGELDRLTAEVTGAYERYQFKQAQSALYNFCNDTMSAVYLAAVKDRLYCDKVDSPRRRRTQTALYRIADQLCRLLAPVLCHTADEAYRSLTGDDEACVHLEEVLPETGVKPSEAWAAAMEARDAGLLAMESAKASGVENPLDMGVTLPDPEGALALIESGDLADLLGVSEVTLEASAGSASVADLRDRARCERSWKRDGTVRERSDGGMLSDRDAEAVGVA